MLHFQSIRTYSVILIALMLLGCSTTKPTTKMQYIPKHLDIEIYKVNIPMRVMKLFGAVTDVDLKINMSNNAKTYQIEVFSIGYDYFNAFIGDPIKIYDTTELRLQSSNSQSRWLDFSYTLHMQSAGLYKVRITFKNDHDKEVVESDILLTSPSLRYY